MTTPRSTPKKSTPKKSAAKKPAAKKPAAEAVEPQNREQRRAASRGRVAHRPTTPGATEARRRFNEIIGDNDEGVTTTIDALEELEAEAEESRDIEPMSIRIGFDEDDAPIVITINTPETLEYAITVSGDYDAILSHAMSLEDWHKLIDARLTTRKVFLIYTAWRLYYGLPEEGEADA